MERKIVLGTRGSELALRQAGLVQEAIRARRTDVEIEKKIIVTRGDRTKIIDAWAGWKGLFTAEIERALIAGDVDVAVHSAKDLPSETNAGTAIAAVLPRAAVNDVLISKHEGGLAGLRKGATVATSSVRRKHQLRWQRADLAIVDLRGNVPTRLRKLAENHWDAIVLARAGIDRLGLSIDFSVELLPSEIFLPAGGQGIVALQIRRDEEQTKTIVDLANDRETLLCLRAEREFLRLLKVDCNAPVGVLAKIENEKMKVRAQFFPDESPAPHEAEVEGGLDQGEWLAAGLMKQIRAE
ncbi:MAG: hydroxymethylbilane synthase [Chthoniobacterales bacterium]